MAGRDPVLACGLLVFRKLDDKDSVLAGKADQHHKPNLGQNVVVHAAEPDAGDGAEQTHGYDQDDRQR